MLREGPPAFRNTHAVAGTDSTKRTSVPPPSAIGPVRYLFCVALRKIRDDAPFTQASPDRLRVITAVAAQVVMSATRNDPALLEVVGWRQPAKAPAGSRYDWHR